VWSRDRLEIESEQMMSTTTSVPTVVPAGTWSVDPAHSKVGFAVKHMGIATVRGEFKQFQGTLEIGDLISSAKAYGTVQVQSVDTNEPQRDEHLRSADFFDAAQYPELAFEATRIEALDDEEFRITGKLTVHGVTNEVVLHADVQGTDIDPWGNERVGLEITGQLSRGDYGMKFNQALGSGNMLVADKVKLALDISAVKQA
jgi:polyisoprenoid-binding protein YceI